jgi:hypothetical protein
VLPSGGGTSSTTANPVTKREPHELPAAFIEPRGIDRSDHARRIHPYNNRHRPPSQRPRPPGQTQN